MARLFFAAPDGQENTQISVQSVGQGATRQEAVFIDASDVIGGGSGLPDGTYVGQPLAWDGAAWLGLVIGDPLRVRLIESTGEADESHLALRTIPNGSVIELATAGTGSNIILRSNQADINVQALGAVSEVSVEATAAVRLVANELASLTVGVGAPSSLNLAATDLLVVTPQMNIVSTVGNEIPGLDALQIQSSLARMVMVGDDTIVRRFMVEIAIDHVGGAGPVIEAGAVAGNQALGFFQAAPVNRPSITGLLPQDQIDSLVAAFTALGLVTDDR